MALEVCCPVACGILVPQPGIEPKSPELEDGVLISGPLRNSPEPHALNQCTTLLLQLP